MSRDAGDHAKARAAKLREGESRVERPQRHSTPADAALARQRATEALTRAERAHEAAAAAHRSSAEVHVKAAAVHDDVAAKADGDAAAADTAPEGA